jgi:hypothetical protein
MVHKSHVGARKLILNVACQIAIIEICLYHSHRMENNIKVFTEVIT